MQNHCTHLTRSSSKNIDDVVREDSFATEVTFPQCSGVRRVSVLGGAERRRRSILVYNRSGYLGAGTGVCPP